jgi:hypothetical protein
MKNKVTFHRLPDTEFKVDWSGKTISGTLPSSQELTENSQST